MSGTRVCANVGFAREGEIFVETSVLVLRNNPRTLAYAPEDCPSLYDEGWLPGSMVMMGYGMGDEVRRDYVVDGEDNEKEWICILITQNNYAIGEARLMKRVLELLVIEAIW